jgi:hypothetical protein
MSAVAAAGTTTCVRAGGRRTVGGWTPVQGVRLPRTSSMATESSLSACAGHLPSGRRSFRKQQTVNPPIAPLRYNFLYASFKRLGIFSRPGRHAALLDLPPSCLWLPCPVSWVSARLPPTAGLQVRQRLGRLCGNCATTRASHRHLANCGPRRHEIRSKSPSIRSPLRAPCPTSVRTCVWVAVDVSPRPSRRPEYSQHRRRPLHTTPIWRHAQRTWLSCEPSTASAACAQCPAGQCR